MTQPFAVGWWTACDRFGQRLACIAVPVVAVLLVTASSPACGEPVGEWDPHEPYYSKFGPEAKVFGISAANKVD